MINIYRLAIRSLIFPGLLIFFLCPLKLFAATLEVGPAGYAYTAIQSAIDAAGTGDTVLVHDGTYIENIDFNGKSITVRS